MCLSVAQADTCHLARLHPCMKAASSRWSLSGHVWAGEMITTHRSSSADPTARQQPAASALSDAAHAPERRASSHPEAAPCLCLQGAQETPSPANNTVSPRSHKDLRPVSSEGLEAERKDEQGREYTVSRKKSGRSVCIGADWLPAGLSEGCEKPNPGMITRL